MSKRPLFPFVIIQGCLWCLFSLIFFYIKGFPTDLLGWFFCLVFLIGHIFLFAWVLGLLAWPFRFIGTRALQAACVGWGGLFSILLTVDLFVFAQYRFHVGLAMLELLLGPANGDIFVFSIGMWLLTAIIILAIFALEAGLFYLAERISLSKKAVTALLSGWFFCFAVYNGLYAWGQFMRVPAIVSQRATLPLAYPFSANRQLRKWGFESKRNPYSVQTKGTLLYPKNPLLCPPTQKSFNILILLVDAWRADMFTAQIMPRLSDWVTRQNMTVFTQHLSGGNATASGVFSLFYSLPYSYWDDFTNLNLPPLLITHSLGMGYEPAIFASSKLNSPTFDRNIFSSIQNLRLGSEGNTPWERDVKTVDDFKHFLDTRQKDTPFFGFIFLDAPHGYSYPPEEKPFVPAKEINYILLNNHTDPTPYLNQYKNSVHFIDKQIDATLSALQQHHLLENTIVLISADHGQELNDSHHNFWGHNSNFTDYQTHVPLIAHFPGRATTPRVDYRTSHYDIAPTLLQAVFHCSNPSADYSIGYNLFDAIPRPFVLLSSYEDKALRFENTIMVFHSFGTFDQYGPRLEPDRQQPSPSLIKDGLKSFGRFYK